MAKKEYFKRASVINKEIDWISIRNEYETTNISLAKLSQKYKKLKMSTLEKRCKREGWAKSKKETQRNIAESMRQKSIENLVTRKSSVIDKHFDISDKFLNIIDNCFKKENEFNTFVEKIRSGYGEGNFDESVDEFVLNSINDKKLLNMVSAFDKTQKAQRQILGIVDNDKLTREDKLKDNEFKKQVHEDRMAIDIERLERGVDEQNDTPTTIVFTDGEDE